jgi:hypothetical protein
VRLEKEGASKETMDVISQSAVYDRAKNFQGLVNRLRVTNTERLLALKGNFLNARVSSFQGAEAFEEIQGLDEALTVARANVASRHSTYIIRLAHHTSRRAVSSRRSAHAKIALLVHIVMMPMHGVGTFA